MTVFGGPPLYVYRCIPIRVHDGDTFVGQLDLNRPCRVKDQDLGFHLKIVNRRLVWEWWVRLTGLNARELAQPGGPEAGTHLAGLIMGHTLSVHSHLVNVGELDLYERVLGDCYVLDGANNEIMGVSKQMITDGYAAPWDGNGPKPLPPWPVQSQASMRPAQASGPYAS